MTVDPTQMVMQIELLVQRWFQENIGQRDPWETEFLMSFYSVFGILCLVWALDWVGLPAS